MPLPFRAHKPVRPAPTASPGSASLAVAGASSAGALGKAELDAALLQQWSRVMSRLPKPGPIMAGAAVAALGYAFVKYFTDLTYAHIAMFMNGIVYHSSCAGGAPTGYRTAPYFFNPSCLSGAVISGVRPMSALPADVAAEIRPGTWYIFMGFQRLSPANPLVPQFRDTDRYRSTVAEGTPASRRPRPFYGPVGVGVPAMPATLAGHPAAPRDQMYSRPWPVWRSSNPALPMQPAPPDAVRDRSRTGSPPLWGSWSTSPGRPLAPTRPGNPARPVVRARPAANTREVKIGANSAQMQIFFAFIKAREWLSEVIDFIDAMFDALPAYIRAEFGGKNATDGQKILAVMNNLELVDGSEFIKNFVEMTLTDWIVGNTFFRGQKGLRDKVFGDRVGTFGPTNFNGGFENYAKMVAQHVKTSLEPMWTALDAQGKSASSSAYRDLPAYFGK